MTSQTQSHGVTGERGGGWGSEVVAAIVVACGVTAARELRGSASARMKGLAADDEWEEGKLRVWFASSQLRPVLGPRPLCAERCVASGGSDQGMIMMI
jgi:hypothetical protein